MKYLVKKQEKTNNKENGKQNPKRDKNWIGRIKYKIKQGKECQHRHNYGKCTEQTKKYIIENETINNKRRAK